MTGMPHVYGHDDLFVKHAALRLHRASFVNLMSPLQRCAGDKMAMTVHEGSPMPCVDEAYDKNGRSTPTDGVDDGKTPVCQGQSPQAWLRNIPNEQLTFLIRIRRKLKMWPLNRYEVGRAYNDGDDDDDGDVETRKSGFASLQSTVTNDGQPKVGSRVNPRRFDDFCRHSQE